MIAYLIAASTPGYRALAAEHLDGLGWAIADTELVAVTRYAEAVPLLRVFHPKVPVVGESIIAAPAQEAQSEAVWWYWLPDGSPLAPCTDLPRTVERIFEALDPIIRIAHRVCSAS
ncbi:hypothetical protein [Actinomadura sp. 9N407]|uniref:hypothetical protein n=1 Tax=Actinomadura sp. 9N407 TaxID=3375154 RepID=UPI00378F822F